MMDIDWHDCTRSWARQEVSTSTILLLLNELIDRVKLVVVIRPMIIEQFIVGNKDTVNAFSIYYHLADVLLFDAMVINLLLSRFFLSNFSLGHDISYISHSPEMTILEINVFEVILRQIWELKILEFKGFGESHEILLETVDIVEITSTAIAHKLSSRSIEVRTITPEVTFWWPMINDIILKGILLRFVRQVLTLNDISTTYHSRRNWLIRLLTVRTCWLRLLLDWLGNCSNKCSTIDHKFI